MFPHIDGLLFENLLLTGLSLIRLETILVTAFACVATFLIKWLVSIRSSVLLFDDKVGRSAEVGFTSLSVLHLQLLFFSVLLQLVGVFANVLEELASGEIILRPLSHIVVGLLLLKTLQDNLVLPCDLH